MLVKEWMSTTVITVGPGASISEAIELLDRHHISMLPVVLDEKLVGIVSDMDLKPFHHSLPLGGFLGPLMLSRVRVEDIMSRAPITVPADFTVEETADVLLKNGVSGVAVVDDDNRIAGIMTQTDINRVLVSVTGLWRGGIVFGFLLEDTPGSIKVLTDIIRAHGGRLASILSSYERSPKGFRRVDIRVRGLARAKLQELVDEFLEKAKLLYWVDQRENTRKMDILLGSERPIINKQ
jgi:acetoin utilization protein AcuB